MKRPGTTAGGVGVAVLLTALFVAGGSAAGDVSNGTPPDRAELPHHASVRDSPGWYPSVDPESMSVVIGRRLNAPRVSQQFRGGARSMDDLGRRICSALHHDAADSMLGLCLTQDEFRDILWREFPQSRPATGLTWRDAWSALQMRLHGGCRSAVQDYGGRYYEFLRFERSDSTAVYRNFKLHSGLTLVAKNDQGEIERFNWLRSVAERKGRFKIYSMRD